MWLIHPRLDPFSVTVLKFLTEKVKGKLFCMRLKHIATIKHSKNAEKCSKRGWISQGGVHFFVTPCSEFYLVKSDGIDQCYQFDHKPILLYLPRIGPYISTIYKVYPQRIAHCYPFNYEPIVIYLPRICPNITIIYKVCPHVLSIHLVSVSRCTPYVLGNMWGVHLKSFTRCTPTYCSIRGGYTL